MLFTSLPFIGFLFVLLAIYYAVPQRFRWCVLLAGSLTFYAYANPVFLLYIGMTVLTAYTVTMRMRAARIRRDAAVAASTDKEARKQYKTQAKAVCRRWMLLGLLANLGALAVIKYADFTVTNINAVSKLFGGNGALPLPHPLMVLGISFYTFQTVGYIVDVYRDKATPEANPFKLALFVSFFPQLIQGPISRYNDLSASLYAGHPFDKNRFSFGTQRVLWGFFKKIIIADRLWPVTQVLFQQTDTYRGGFVPVGMLIYIIALYADFSGGIDITIGVAELFGVKLVENFDRPFYSKNIAEYWRRWHISMGAWFRDYIFYPLSVSKPMLRLSKNTRAKLGDSLGKRIPVYISILTVWFLTGLWHGATWNFIAWGLANGIVIAISQEFQPLYNRFNTRFPFTQSKAYGTFQIVRTFWLMCFIRAFDCYEGVWNTFTMLFSVFQPSGWTRLFNEGLRTLGFTPATYIGAGLGLVVVLWVSFLQRGGTDIRERLAVMQWPVRYTVFGLLLFMIIIFGAYGIGYNALQFRYNQF